MGFESGTFCVYPNYRASEILDPIVNADSGCVLKDEFVKQGYADASDFNEKVKSFNAGDSEESPIRSYDPRCRRWYLDQKERLDNSIFTDVYIFASGKPGITNCVPLKVADSTGRHRYYGAYCLDQYPTSKDGKFVNQYYSTNKVGELVNYMIFNKNVSESTISDWL